MSIQPVTSEHVQRMRDKVATLMASTNAEVADPIIVEDIVGGYTLRCSPHTFNAHGYPYTWDHEVYGDGRPLSFIPEGDISSGPIVSHVAAFRLYNQELRAVIYEFGGP